MYISPVFFAYLWFGRNASLESSSPVEAVKAVEFGNADLDPVPADAADRKIYFDIHNMKWWDACLAWGREARKPKLSKRGEFLAKHLMAERMLSKQDLAIVPDKGLEIGMTECGMFASKGMPEQSNHTTTAAGTSTQHVYPGNRFYVYTEPNRAFSVNVVRAIQH